ncbi:hypothetical protein [Altererythrobacter sp. MF3-039]|uniref:hypothetical protein n=1 Tax=Altererythrobacter sp. MF3-039 TaxID=3252901 RepID=UPI00390C6DB7
MIEVGDSAANMVLNLCFFAIVFVAILSFVPWGKIGLVKLGKAMKWAWLPVLVLAVTYESTMPSRFDIRLDLLILIPAYLALLCTCAIRWWQARLS